MEKFLLKLLSDLDIKTGYYGTHYSRYEWVVRLKQSSTSRVFTWFTKILFLSTLDVSLFGRYEKLKNTPVSAMI